MGGEETGKQLLQPSCFLDCYLYISERCMSCSWMLHCAVTTFVGLRPSHQLGAHALTCSLGERHVHIVCTSFLATWACLRVFSARCWAGSWVISLARRFLDGTLQPPGLYCMFCVSTAMPQDCMMQLSCVLVWSESERRKKYST